MYFKTSENLLKNVDQNVELHAKVYHFKLRFQNFSFEDGDGGISLDPVDFQGFLSFLIGSPGCFKVTEVSEALTENYVLI